MKKANFMTLILATLGGILFAVGMCMCLLPQWNAFRPGLVLGVLGAAALLALIPLRRRMAGKPAIRFTGKSIAAAVLAVAGALTLGVGMCMTMVWEGLLLPGILVGVLGILLLLCLIPLCRGLH